MQARVLEGLGRLTADSRDTLLVTHGGVIAVIMAQLFPEERKTVMSGSPPPAADTS